MDFLQLFFGFIGRVLLGWEPSPFVEPAATGWREKGGSQIDPDG